LKIFYRIVLTVYALCIMVLSALFIIMAFSHNFIWEVYNYILNNLLADTTGAVLTVIVALFFFITGFIFIVSGFRKKKELQYVSKLTDFGEIKISLDSIESIALTVTSKMNGVRDTRAVIKKIEDTVAVVIRLIVLPEINIPSLSQQIQEAVKESVEENSGIKVNSVEVFVENIAQGAYKKEIYKQE
jgi:uncharacterized alkaline shock family protein YloU